MSAKLEITPTSQKITVEDVKRRAAAVRDLTVSEARRKADEILHDQVTKVVIVGVVAVVALTSLAYYIGSRRRRG